MQLRLKLTVQAARVSLLLGLPHSRTEKEAPRASIVFCVAWDVQRRGALFVAVQKLREVDSDE